jgi:hypothetical protein
MLKEDFPLFFYFKIIYNEYGESMEIKREKRQNKYYYDYYLTNDDVTLKIMHGEQNDLYFMCLTDKKEETLRITKENYELYVLFKKIIEDIQNPKIFELTEEDVKNSQDLYELKEKYNRWNQALKNSNYNMLYHQGKVHYFSDDEKKELANSFIIEEQEDEILVTFILKDKQNKGPVIHIKDDTSRYKPFNTVFLDFFWKLQEIDPAYHQIHLEEYAYEKRKKKTKCE